MISGSSPRREPNFKDPTIKVFLFTFEGLVDEWEVLTQHHPEVKTVIVDEWHLGFSGPESKRIEALNRINRSLYSLVPMTGTILKGKYSAAFPAIHMLAPEYYGSLSTFMMTHAILDENLKPFCLEESGETLRGVEAGRDSSVFYRDLWT